MIVQPDVSEEEVTPETPTNFEAAMEALGFGPFNICLILTALPGMLATLFMITNICYVLPIAECDLSLGLLQKGALNAMTYGGMILSAVPWGYFADTQGRKRALIFGLLAMGVFDVGAALSESATQLMMMKFLGGMMVCGPTAIIMSYVLEFHGKRHRPRVLLSLGIMQSLGGILLPVLALGVLPRKWDFKFLGLHFFTWEIYLAITAIPSFLSGSLITLFPESPKFLMSQGRNSEALEGFKRIYSLNSGKPKESFQIKTLVDEAPDRTAKRTSTRRESLRAGIQQQSLMFSRPYLKQIIVGSFMMLCILMGTNSIRLWLPQVFASITEYEALGHHVSSMCNILDYTLNKSRIINAMGENDSCEVVITSASYRNNIIVAIFSFCGYIVAIMFVDITGPNVILTVCLFIASAFGFGFYWTSSNLSVLVIACFFMTSSAIAVNTVVNATFSRFPTDIRTMVIIIMLTCGRVGTVFGNLLFPTFVSIGCVLPFAMIGAVFFIAFLCSLSLPNSINTDLQ